MSDSSDVLVQRLNMLGLACDEVPSDRLTSAVAALACLPMYMVANVHAWTDDTRFEVPLLDLPGSAQIREAFAIGEQEATLHLEARHRKVLGGFLRHARPADRVIYEYALETLRLFLAGADPKVAQAIRVGVARMVVAVAAAAGKGLFGTGSKITPQERACILEIAAVLELPEDSLQAIGPES
jgi:hypothetical protein